jgi:hypothetical protein
MELLVKHCLNERKTKLHKKIILNLSADGSHCNPNYFGDQNQEDHGSRPVQESSSVDPIISLKDSE